MDLRQEYIWSEGQGAGTVEAGAWVLVGGRSCVPVGGAAGVGAVGGWDAQTHPLSCPVPNAPSTRGGQPGLVTWDQVQPSGA